MTFLLTVCAAFLVAFAAGALLVLWAFVTASKYGIAKGLNL